jgi:hypothetical protein
MCSANWAYVTLYWARMNVAISDDKQGAVRDMKDESERKNSSTCL